MVVARISVCGVRLLLFGSALLLLTACDGVARQAERVLWEMSTIPRTLPVTTQGYGQRGWAVGYGFIVENPTPYFAVEESQYQVTVLDGSGAILRTRTAWIRLLAPSQRLGLAGIFELPVGADVAELAVQIKTGKFRAPHNVATLSTADVAFHPYGPGAPKVIGVAANGYPKDVTQVEVYALPYDAFGAIIGGGSATLGFVPGGGQAPVEVPVVTSALADLPATVELYAALGIHSRVE